MKELRSEESNTAGRGSRLRRVLEHRWVPLWVALAAMVLALPSLGVGWVMDDLWHRAILTELPLVAEFFPSKLDLFRFFDGDPERMARMMDLGIVPWWINPEAKGAFWRPLTSMTHWLDYRLWPDLPVLMHAQSILWFGGLAFAVACLYRRMMGLTAAAGLAALLYAIDDARGMPVGFLANRNAFPATLFGVCAILAHAQWRDRGRVWASVAAPILLTASLLSKESGIATVAYLVSYAAFIDRGPWKNRVVSLVPCAAVVVVWRILWTRLGYGVGGVGLYVEPLTDPLDFLMALGARAPLILMGQWLGPPSGITLLFGSTFYASLWAASAVVLTVVGMLLLPLLREDRTARFWALGMVLAVVPACTTFPQDRLLFFVGIGAMGLLGQFLVRVFGRRDKGDSTPRPGFGTRSAAVVLVVFHLAIAPALLMARAAQPIGPRKYAEDLMVRAALDESVDEQDVIIVNPPSPIHAIYFPVTRGLDGLTLPRRTRVLAPGHSPLEVERPDAYTLEIRTEQGFLHAPFDRLFRDADSPLGVGSRVELTGLTIEVIEATADGEPVAARYRFSVPLEDASLRWLCWVEGDFEECAPPAIGETTIMTYE